MTQVEHAGDEFRRTLTHFLSSLVAKRDFAGAIKCYHDNVSLIDSAGGAWTGTLLHHVAQAYASLSNLPAALRMARSAQSHLENASDRQTLAELFITLGGILRDMGENGEAEKAFRDAESIFRRHDCPEGQSKALNLLAGLYYRKGDFKNSLSILLEAVTIAKRLGNLRQVAFMMGNIGRINTFIGDFRQARKHLELNIELSTELNDLKETAKARVALGYVFLQEGRLSEAKAVLDRALAETERIGLSRDAIICRSYLGELAYRQGDLELGRTVLSAALEAARAISADSSLCGRIMRHLAEVDFLSGRNRFAQRMAARAAVIVKRHDDIVELGALTRLKALLAFAAGDRSSARSLMAKAIDRLEESGVRFEKAITLVAAGRSTMFSSRQRLTYLFQAEEFYSRHELSVLAEAVNRHIAEIDYVSSRPTQKGQTRKSVAREDEFLTNNAMLKRFKSQLPAIGQADLPLLLTGETGVGKDQMARFYRSVTRPDGPLVAINCASLPEALLESELFGYVKGAFTGADGSKQGLFVTANGGVLFLDEIGDMPLGLQGKLLGVLESRKVTPLGSVKPVALDFKLVAATNQDLEAMVEAGTFRRDLYYRLGGMCLTIPPLRERKEDMPTLMTRFMESCRLLEEGEELPTELVRQFLSHNWPGNAREVFNKIRRLAVMSDMVADGDLAELSRTIFEKEIPHPDRTLFEQVEQFERQLIVEALLAARGNRSEAARMLGIHEATVRTKLKRYGISLEGGVPS